MTRVINVDLVEVIQIAAVILIRHYFYNKINRKVRDKTLSFYLLSSNYDKRF